MTRPDHRSVPRRSELCVPGARPTMLEKAARLGADSVVLDLEDAVAPADREAARSAVCSALGDLNWRAHRVGVRVNALGSGWGLRDVETIVRAAGDHLDFLVLPKVVDALDVLVLDRILGELEAELKLAHRVGIEVLIECAEALLDVRRIATSSQRVEALVIGFGDLAVSLGMRSESIGEAGPYDGDPWHAVRVGVLAAARAAGCAAIDGPVARYDTPEPFLREAERAATLGLSGKWVIHPSQIEPANQCFSVSHSDVNWAREVMALLADGDPAGAGALHGSMVDEASVRRAAAILERAEHERRPPAAS